MISLRRLTYNSNCISKNNPNKAVSLDGFTNKCTGGDKDLATGKGKYKKNGKWYTYESEAQGQVLIVQENNNSPDDLAGGAKITFDFTDELGVNFHDIGLLVQASVNRPSIR